MATEKVTAMVLDKMNYLIEDIIKLSEKKVTLNNQYNSLSWDWSCKFTDKDTLNLDIGLYFEYSRCPDGKQYYLGERHFDSPEYALSHLMNINWTETTRFIQKYPLEISRNRLELSNHSVEIDKMLQDNTSWRHVYFVPYEFSSGVEFPIYYLLTDEGDFCLSETSIAIVTHISSNLLRENSDKKFPIIQACIPDYFSPKPSWFQKLSSVEKTLFEQRDKTSDTKIIHFCDWLKELKAEN
jgi:2-hydroxy-3-keto-5-methylthiopentenyl-1-phosphate phosphatase